MENEDVRELVLASNELKNRASKAHLKTTVTPEPRPGIIFSGVA